MSPHADITVSENSGRSRYDASTESGVVAGFAEYRDRDGIRVFTHTEVDDAFEGQGVGSTLARAALDDVRRRELKVRAECEFIHAWIQRHPEYDDLRAG